VVFLRIRCAQFYAKKPRCKSPLSKALDKNAIALAGVKKELARKNETARLN